MARITANKLPKDAARGLRIGIVVSRFNARVTARLRQGVLGRLRELGGGAARSVEVPGAFELGLAAKELAATGGFDAVICLAAILRGETSHFEVVCRAAQEGVLRAGLDTGVPVIFGVLTCDHEQQALQRCSGGGRDSGRYAADAAVSMARLIRSLRRGP